MIEKAFKLGFAFGRGLSYSLQKRMAMDSWVTLQNKEGENYRVDLPGENPSDSSKKPSESKNDSRKSDDGDKKMPHVEVMPPKKLKETIVKTIKGMVPDGMPVKFEKVAGRMISYNGRATSSTLENLRLPGFSLHITSADTKGNPIVNVEMYYPKGDKNPKVKEFVDRVSHVITEGHPWKTKGSEIDGQKFWEGYQEKYW